MFRSLTPTFDHRPLTPNQYMSLAESIEKRAAEFAERYKAVQKQLGRVIVGHDDIVHGVLTCLFVGGHCLGGIGRTGTVVGCYLLRHGLATRTNVFDIIEKLRINDPTSYIRSPESEAQQHFVQNWREQKL